MSTFPTCPQCGLENTYSDGALWVCPDCGHEWGDDAPGQAEAGPVVRDCNGHVLAAGAAVTVLKALQVKGCARRMFLRVRQGHGEPRRLLGLHQRPSLPRNDVLHRLGVALRDEFVVQPVVLRPRCSPPYVSAPEAAGP